MTRRLFWLTAGGCVAGWILIAWTLNWFTGQLAAESGSNSVRLAYKPVSDMPPPVDLASVQRGWPDSLDQQQSRRLQGYLHDIEGQAPPPAATAPQPAATPELDLGTLLANADAKTGKAKAQVCMSCHDLSSGGPNRVGPNLWQVVGRDIASRPGFTYSPAMTGRQGSWTYDMLDDFLARPARTVPGTKMTFAGLRRPEDRAAVIRFLATLGTNPPPFPQREGGADAKAR
ncbi:MAG TPA: cytochrome c family protein [Novosphingobium sp.]|nr:cytochrome c family protein [Novosphingobium sp.]